MNLLMKYIKIGFSLLLLAGFLSACSKMDDTYKEFLKDGYKIYPGKPSNATVFPGKNRLMLTWPMPSDPKVVKAKIYWNAKSDSIEISIDRTRDSVKVPFNNLIEGLYIFKIISYDSKGNPSVPVEARGRVYGEQYEKSLLPRPIDATIITTDTLQIQWGAIPDTSLIGSQIVYKNKENEITTLFVSKDNLFTDVLEFHPQTFKHRSVYLPHPNSIDTFFTSYSNIKIKGPPVELSKQGWTATSSSYDIAGKRPPFNAIDNNPATIWVNQTRNPAFGYPHTITVDMGMLHEDLEGFAIITRVGDASARPRTIDLYTSIDGDTWLHHGTTVLDNTGDNQLIGLSEPVNARYFRMTATDAFSGSNIALAEIGMYYR